MRYLNFDTLHLRSPEFLGSSTVDRGVWLSVCAYSVDQENGGRIKGAALWTRQQWSRAAGVTEVEVRKANRILIREGDDIIVHDYPIKHEIECKRKRSAGQSTSPAKTHAAQSNGRLGGRPGTPRKPPDIYLSETQLRESESEREIEREISPVSPPSETSHSPSGDKYPLSPEFSEQERNEYGDQYALINQHPDPISVAMRICKENTPLSINSWKKARREIGDKELRRCLTELSGEMKAGEVENPGAILALKFKRARESRTGTRSP